MDPRLPSSARWTALPGELVSQIQDLFLENFAKQIGKKSQVIVEGRIYQAELLLRVGFVEAGELRQRNFEVSIDFDPQKENALKQIHLAIDCAASMMDEYFSSDAKDPWDEFPKIWQAFEVQGKTVFLQVSAINSSLEAEADRLLGDAVDKLVKGEDPEADLKAVVTMLGLDGDEDEEAKEASGLEASTKHKTTKPTKH